jgi:hypothetical protein
LAAGVPAATAAAILAAQGGGVSAADPTAQPVEAPNTTGLTPSPSGGLPADINAPGLGSQTLDYIKAHPLLAATAISALAGAGSGNKGVGSGAVNTAAGTRASLDPLFTTSLPPPTFGVRHAVAPTRSDWSTYGMRPEQAFFDNVAVSPQPPARDWGLDTNLLANQRLADATGYAGDFGSGGFQDWIVNQPDRTKEIAREILNQSGEPYRVHFASGGDVSGDGDGRSDSIPARLSDGEYVMDAETVSMLGDGSSKAGAKKLDQFRVKLRKQKGRNLARGKFSVNAGPVERYVGGRVHG